MNKTKIEWCDYTWNPIKGLCTIGCHYCYARKFYKRFGWDEDIRFDYDVLHEPERIKKPSKIFVCSTMDVGCREVLITPGWITLIGKIAKECPRHTFIFLSKNSMEAYQFRHLPSNCWLGTTLDGVKGGTCYRSTENISFINYEPLQNDSQSYYCKYAMYGMDWVIVGGLTPKPIHKKEWVDDIIKEARRQKIPIFLKDNLHYPKVIKEFPKSS